MQILVLFFVLHCSRSKPIENLHTLWSTFKQLIISSRVFTVMARLAWCIFLGLEKVFIGMRGSTTSLLIHTRKAFFHLILLKYLLIIFFLLIGIITLNSLHKPFRLLIRLMWKYRLPVLVLFLHCIILTLVVIRLLCNCLDSLLIVLLLLGNFVLLFPLEFFLKDYMMVVNHIKAWTIFADQMD